MPGIVWFEVKRFSLICWIFSFGLYISFAFSAGGAKVNHLGLKADPITTYSQSVMFGDVNKVQEALRFFKSRAKQDVAAVLINTLRYRPSVSADISDALQKLTGHIATTWHDWMLWQQSHPEIKPHKSFVGIKRDGLARVDPRYRIFFREGSDQPSDLRIRVEEIVWGGPPALTGIPSLDHPKMSTASEASYMQDDDLVFGVEINGDVRAYPLRIMGWHEMFNDVIGGVPVALAYCTLCGSGILFETQRKDRAKAFVFGSSGMLYRSNKLMFDWETLSLSNQFTGEPVVGPLTKTKIVLKTRPVAITTWRDWRKKHPGTLILSLDTGFKRDYRSGVVYQDYFASPSLMFPAAARKFKSFQKKEFIFGIRAVGVAKAWPLTAFEGRRIINDRLGRQNIVLIGNAKNRTVHAYERKNKEFETQTSAGLQTKTGENWQISDANLISAQGQKLPRIAGILSYWFAWDGYMGLKSEYYQAKP